MKHYVDPEVMQRVLATLPRYRGEALNLTVHPWAILSAITDAARHYSPGAAVDIWREAAMLRTAQSDIWTDCIVTHRGVRQYEHEPAEEEMVG